MIKKLINIFSSSRSDFQREKEIAEIYDQNKDKFIGYMLKFCPVLDKNVYEEIYHDSFLVFYQNIHDGKLTYLNSKISTYLIGLGKNKTLKYLEKQNKQAHISYMNDFPDVPEEKEQEKEKRMQNIAYEFVNKMDVRCKQVLELFYWKKKSMGEIAQEMNLGSEQSAKNRKHLCLKKIMEPLKEQFQKEGLI